MEPIDNIACKMDLNAILSEETRKKCEEIIYSLQKLEYDLVKKAPIKSLLGYLINMKEDISCLCCCKKEVWIDIMHKPDIEKAEMFANARENTCKEMNRYDKCPQRLAYERIMEVIDARKFKKSPSVSWDDSTGCGR